MTRHVALIDDHPLVTAGLRASLERLDMTVDVIDPEIGNDDIVAAIQRSSPDCVVVDLGLPVVGGGLALVTPLTALGLPVMVLTGETERWMWAQAAHAGAVAVYSKADPMGEVIDAISRVAKGEEVQRNRVAELRIDYESMSAERRRRTEVFDNLSQREQQILAGLIEGLSPQRIADRDFVSIQTVRSQIKSLTRKLGVTSQLEAVALANESGWEFPT